MTVSSSLIQKYNIPGPRYTSYPPVPEWNPETYSESNWIENFTRAIINSKQTGISIYIHLPYCESLCTYCGCNTRITKNHLVETPYIESLLMEWKMICDKVGEKPYIREIHLGGGTPTFFSSENLEKLILGLLEDAALLPGAGMAIEGHPNHTKEEQIIMLSSLGFNRISFGIQDFDPKVQQAVNRIQSPAQVRKVLGWSRKYGFDSVNFDLIYGLPFQTIESIEHTIELVREMKPDRIAFYSYAHVPWIKPGQRSFSEKDLPSGNEKRALYDRGLELLSEAGYKEIGFDHFALENDELFKAFEKGTLHRNFMGYTDNNSKTVIGLGVSAISDTGNYFSQNHKTVEEYKESILLDQLPLLKGHCLNEVELITRTAITDLMCRHKTDLKPLIPYIIHPSESLILKDMQKDGLIHITDDLILSTTESGRPFLRNICIAIDPAMIKKIDRKGIYSDTI